MGFGLSGSAHVTEWLARTENPFRREKLLLWLKWVCVDPEMLTTGYYQHNHKPQMVMNYSDVPGADTRVSFLVRDIPSMCIHILDISDGHYVGPRLEAHPVGGLG